MARKKELKANGADLYLSDLRTEMRDSILRDWKEQGETKLLMAYNADKEIIIGKYGEQGLAF